MKKIIFGIFAHPDDEAFGPSSTLLSEVKNGADVHLLTLTNGGAGANPDNHDNLEMIRMEEWQKSGALIGATSMHFLGYKDGQLDNQSMIEAGNKIMEIVTTIIASYADDVDIEFMTMDTNGATGHIDHIVASRATCWAFYRLKATDSRISRVRLICIPRSQLPVVSIDWLYMEAGRFDNEIDETTDHRDLRDETIAIIRAHHSQRADGERVIEQHGDMLGMNYFIVKT